MNNINKILSHGLSGDEFLSNRDALKKIDISKLNDTSIKAMDSQVKWIEDYFQDEEKFINHLKEGGVDTAVFQLHCKINGTYSGNIDGIWGEISQGALDYFTKSVKAKQEAEKLRKEQEEKSKQEAERLKKEKEAKQEAERLIKEKEKIRREEERLKKEKEEQIEKEKERLRKEQEAEKLKIEGTKGYTSMDEFLQDNNSFNTILDKDIESQVVVYDEKEDSVHIGTQEGEIEFIDKNKIVVRFSDAPNDPPAIVDITSALPLNNESIKEIIRLTRAFGRLSLSRKYKYDKANTTHWFTHDKGNIGLTYTDDKKEFWYVEYDTDFNKIRSQFLTVNDEIRYNFEIDKKTNKLIRQEKIKGGDKVFEDSYILEKDSKQGTGFYKTHGEPVMTLGGGEIIKIYDSAEFKDENAYFEYLAKKLDTPYKLSKLFEEMMRYTYDSEGTDANEEGDTQTPGSGDYYWTPEQLVNRTSTRGYMLGDCDDYTGLASEILKRQGKRAFDVYVPGHVTTVGIDKIGDGKFIVYSIGTFGLDINGIRGPFPMNAKWEDYAVDEVKPALSNVMKKFAYMFKEAPPVKGETIWEALQRGFNNLKRGKRNSAIKKGEFMQVYTTSENTYASGKWRVDRDYKDVQIDDLL